MKKENSEEQKIAKIISLMQTDDSVDAPLDSIKWAKDIFRARAAEPEKSAVKKFLAVLQMDLSPGKAAFGERSASASQARQMLFQAGETAVDLRISKGEKGFSLHGQILGEGFENCRIKLGRFETVADELGEFRFNRIPKGIYDLILKTENGEIVIENLELSENDA
ncbi:MAG TPA: hypothetical protein VK892_15235 [Pyrinomonadaceae bacterium]|nr:hypothetical protein [Pyrinomonadaceae bacterium]